MAEKCMQILVVDDEPALRSFAGVVLEDLGYEALPAENGRAAVQLLLQDPERVQAVLLDMTMPGLSAEETFRLMREISPTLPVIVVSGDLESTVRERFGAGTIAGCIQKPYSDVDLEETLGRVLAEQAQGSTAGEVPEAAFRLEGLLEAEVNSIKMEYLATCRSQLQRLKELLRAGDFEALRVMGHSFKGSGGCFGLSDLSNMGRSLEQAARAKDQDGCALQVAALTAELEKE